MVYGKNVWTFSKKLKTREISKELETFYNLTEILEIVNICKNIEVW